MSEMNKAWTSRQEESEDSRRFHEQDRLVVWTMDSLAEAMAKNKISKADIAKKIGCSRAYITQIFSGSRNPTLNTIADLAWALGLRTNISLEQLREGQFISVPVCSVGNVVKMRRPKVTVDRHIQNEANCREGEYANAEGY